MANTTNGISVFAPAAIVALVIIAEIAFRQMRESRRAVNCGQILIPPRISIVPGGYIVSRLRLS